MCDRHPSSQPELLIVAKQTPLDFKERAEVGARSERAVDVREEVGRDSGERESWTEAGHRNPPDVAVHVP